MACSILLCESIVINLTSPLLIDVQGVFNLYLLQIMHIQFWKHGLHVLHKPLKMKSFSPREIWKN